MTDLLGQTIANRRLEALLGSGELGQVFRVRHLGLERDEAVKIIHPAIAGVASFAQRFAQEMGAIEQLDHTHIIEIFGAGEENGQCYLAMEFMDPGSLGRALERRARNPQSLPLSVGLDIIRQAADGLAAAHAQGLVHRNIKPDNVLLSAHRPDQASSSLLVKISDFGLKPSNDVATTPNTDLGTVPAIIPIYWSPEQFMESELDGRSDVYSLGMVLYELATGLLPFSIKSFDQAGITHLRTPPRPPREVRPELPPELEAIILRCLAKQPEQRFVSAKELSDALQGVIQTLRSTEASVPKAPLTPPLIDPLPDLSALPRVQVADQQGKRVLPVRELTGDGLTVGRHNSDIVLDDATVAEQHALVDWDGIQVHITDQGSESGTFLEKTRLQTHTSQPWNWGQAVRVGPFWLRLEAPSAPIRPLPTNGHVQQQAQTQFAPPLVPRPPSRVQAQIVSPPPATSQSLPASQATVLGTHISVVLQEPTLILTPGEPAVCLLTILNKGDQVHHLRITVDGVPGAWVRELEESPMLNPNRQMVVTLNIVVPRRPESKARDYPVIVHVQSEDTPSEVGVAPAVWTVKSFAESSMSVPKKRRRSWRRGRFDVVIRNEGNTSDRYAISGADEEEVLTYEPEPAQLTLKENDSTRARLIARAPLYWFGRPQRHDLTIQVKPEAEANPKVERVQFLQRAIIPVWAIPIAILLLLAAAGLLYWWTLPEISYLTVDPSAVIVGKQGQGQFVVVHGRTIDLQATGVQVSTAPATTVAFTTTTKFSLIAREPTSFIQIRVKNWLGIATMKEFPVHVITPTLTLTATSPPPTTAIPPPPSLTRTSSPTPPPSLTPTLSPSTTPTASKTPTPTITSTPETTLPCANGTSTAVRGVDRDVRGHPVPLLVYLVQTNSNGITSERSITGGTTDINGYFNIPITIENLRAGKYGLVVRERYTGKEVRSFTCPVPATPVPTVAIAPTRKK